MGMHSTFIGSNVNPRVQKKYAEKFDRYTSKFIENDTPLILFLEKINVWKLYGYLTSDVIEEWKQLFDSICSDPINQTIWEEKPILYVLFQCESLYVVYWKYTIQTKQLEMYIGNERDANYFISKKLKISVPIKEQIENPYHLAPDDIDTTWKQLHTIYDNINWQIDYKRIWYCIFYQSDLFKQVKLNTLLSDSDLKSVFFK